MWKEIPFQFLLFFHGGGWVTESVENYDRVCSRMAQATATYRGFRRIQLAPEHKFSDPLEGLFMLRQKRFNMNQQILKYRPQKITIIVTVRGGNLTAAVCLMARDRGEFTPRRRYLSSGIGKLLYREYTYRSVHENGSDYLLTAVKNGGLPYSLSKDSKDRQNPYLRAILEKNLRNLPETLILTAEYDPLRRRGSIWKKASGGRKSCGKSIEFTERFMDFLARGFKFLHVQESFSLLMDF